MKSEKPTSPDARALRQLAEQKLRERKALSEQPPSRTDVRELVHELQVHQIELEMQNDELRRAEAQSEEALDKYTDLFDFAPIGYFQLAQDGVIRGVNLAGAALLGLERSRVVSRRFGGWVAPASLLSFANFSKAVLASDTEQTCEIRLLCQGRGALDVQLDGLAAPDRAGLETSWRLAVLDITEQKRTEEALRFLAQSGAAVSGENFFQKLARYLGRSLGMDYVCIDRLEEGSLAARTLAVYFDGKFEDNVSYTLKDTPCGDVAGKTICCFPKDVRHLFPKDAVLQHMMAESYVGVTLWGPQGQPIGLIAVIGRQPLADTRSAASILQVVAVRAAAELERQQAESALRESELRYRAIGESMDYGVWVCAPDGRNTYASPSFLRLVGLTQEQCSNFGWGDVLHPDDAARTIAAWQECVRTGGKWDIEHRFRGVDGQYHPVLARGVPIRNERGEIVCWAGINLDISRLKEAEEGVRRRADELRATNEELNRFNEAMVGRELRMIELKQEVNALCAQLGQPPRYRTGPGEEARPTP